jgi:acyl-CoA dehydrogenase
MTSTQTALASAVDRARGAAKTLAEGADAVDRESIFPREGIAALAEADLLAGAAPQRYGGADLSVEELAAIARILGRACGSTAMVWAMHQVQVACIATHNGGEATVEEMLTELIASGGLIASVTSEVGVGGDLRRSHAALQQDGEESRLEKQAPTVSYAADAAAFLVTARRSPEASEGDQVLALVKDEQVRVEQLAAWDMMGMRGTCSPPCAIAARFPTTQVLPVPFGDIAALTMVPLSHILWSAVWIGAAEEALARATAMLRKKETSSPGPAGIVRASQRLQMLDGLLRTTIDHYTSKVLPTGQATREFGVLANNLKLSASTFSVDIATEALEICGMAGYAEAGPFSISRILRDLFSARLMISNARLVDTNALSLLLERYR